MASEIRVNKLNSQTGVGTITLSPTGVDISGVTTVSTLRSNIGIFSGTVTGEHHGDGSNLTGVASTENIRTNTNATFLQNINVSGTSTVAGTSTANLFSGSGASLTSIPAANIVGLATAGFERSGGFPQGLTVAQQFRLTSGLNVTNSATTLSANWEKVDGVGQGALGSFADPSSGIFTFPSTGIYLVRFNGYFEDTGDTPLGQLRILATTNNSSYTAIAEVNTSNSNLDTYTYCSGSVETILDVTDTSNVKVYFDARNSGTANLDGNSAQNRTYVTFIRLGDT